MAARVDTSSGRWICYRRCTTTMLPALVLDILPTTQYMPVGTTAVARLVQMRLARSRTGRRQDESMTRPWSAVGWARCYQESCAAVRAVELMWRVACGPRFPAEYAICELSYSACMRVHKTQGQAEFLVGWNSYGVGWRSGLGIMPALRGGDCGSVAHTTAKRPQHAPNPRSGQRQPTKPAWVMAEGSVVKLARDGVQRVCKEGVRDRIMVHLCHSADMSGSEVRALKFSHFLLHADVGSGTRVQVKGRVVGRRKDVELCVVGALALHLYFTDSQGDKGFGSPLEGKPAISPGVHVKNLCKVCERQNVDRQDLQRLPCVSPGTSPSNEREEEHPSSCRDSGRSVSRAQGGVATRTAQRAGSRCGGAEKKAPATCFVHTRRVQRSCIRGVCPPHYRTTERARDFQKRACA